MATPQQQRRAKEDRAYARFRREYLYANPWCQASGPIGLVDPDHDCGQRATQVHHRRLVTQGGHRTLPANVIASCGLCHDWIHHNVAKAAELGLLVQSDSDEYGRLGKDSDPRSLP